MKQEVLQSRKGERVWMICAQDIGTAVRSISYDCGSLHRGDQSGSDPRTFQRNEHFLTDIHGEYEAFSHVLKNGSGAVRKKIDDVFGLAMDKADKAALATLIYYPREKMELIKQDEPDMDSWYKTTLYKLIEVCKTVSSKYTRSKVRKALPEEYAYVIEELITESRRC